MSRRHTPAVSEQDKKCIHYDKKNGLTGRGGGRRDTSVQKIGYGADRGQGVVEKLDTEADREVDGTTWERTEAGGRGTEAKKDTSLARRPR